MPLLGISLTPVGTKSASFSSTVTSAVHTIEERGLKYLVTPTETIIEGELDELLEVAKEIHQNAMASTNRVITNITIDDRRDKEVNMDEQVDIVTQSLR
ncbi:MAG: MTH1187 family thiamine-binding protein [Syntrophaceticus sp.]